MQQSIRLGRGRTESGRAAPNADYLHGTENLIMEKIVIQRPRRNPIAAAPILRKGGAHRKSKTAERIQVRVQLKRESTEWCPPR